MAPGAGVCERSDSGSGLAAREGGRAGWNDGRSDLDGSGKEEGGMRCLWSEWVWLTGEWMARLRSNGSPCGISLGVTAPELKTDSSPASGRMWLSSLVECDAVLCKVQTSGWGASRSLVSFEPGVRRRRKRERETYRAASGSRRCGAVQVVRGQL